MITTVKKPTTKKITAKNYVKFLTGLSSKIIPKNNKTHNFPCGELHKSQTKTVQATNGRQGIVITGLYNENYADKIINPILKQEITDYTFPKLEEVIPHYTSPNYEKVTVTIPKFKSKKSRINVVKTWEGIKFVEFKDALEEDAFEGEFCFQVNADRLNLFSGYTVNLYFSSVNKVSTIVVESLPELTEKLNIKFTYVTVPNWTRR